MVTNGRRLASRNFLDRLINAGLSHVSISIEGSTELIHNSITRANSFKQVMRAIQNCVESGVSFNTLLTISKHNLTEIAPLSRRLKSMGVRNILFNVGLPSVGSPEDEIDSFVVHPQKVANIMQGAYKLLATEGIKIKFLATLPLCLFDQEILDEMIDKKYVSNGSHCHIFYGSGVAFEANGNVLPCTHFVEHPLFNMNDLKIETAEEFADAWYSENGMHGSFMRKLWNYPVDKCRDCRYWGKCVGGCPFLWTHFDPDDIIGRKEVMEFERRNTD